MAWGLRRLLGRGADQRPNDGDQAPERRDPDPLPVRVRRGVDRGGRGVGAGRGDHRARQFPLAPRALVSAGVSPGGDLHLPWRREAGEGAHLRRGAWRRGSGTVGERAVTGLPAGNARDA